MLNFEGFSKHFYTQNDTDGGHEEWKVPHDENEKLILKSHFI